MALYIPSGDGRTHTALSQQHDEVIGGRCGCGRRGRTAQYVLVVSLLVSLLVCPLVSWYLVSWLVLR